MCYRVAAQAAEHDSFVRITAQAGEAVLLLSLDSGKIENDDEAREGQQTVLTKNAKAIANVCREMGGTLEAVGQIIEALSKHRNRQILS